VPNETLERIGAGVIVRVTVFLVVQGFVYDRSGLVVRPPRPLSVNVRHMSHALRFLGSLTCAGLIVLALARVWPGRFDIVLYWPLPFFHLFFQPLASGPSPLAAFCSLVTDAVILAGLIFWFLIWRGRRSA